MKFNVDHALHSFKVMLRTKKGQTDGRTDGRTDGQTDAHLGRTDGRVDYYMPPFGGIKSHVVNFAKQA